jgi:hypothetical protein
VTQVGATQNSGRPESGHGRQRLDLKQQPAHHLIRETGRRQPRKLDIFVRLSQPVPQPLSSAKRAGRARCRLAFDLRGLGKPGSRFFVGTIHPAAHYVMIDDKLRILAAMKAIWGNRLTTVFPRQGRYALDPVNVATYPPADISVERIGDLLDHDFRLH